VVLKRTTIDGVDLVNPQRIPPNSPIRNNPHRLYLLCRQNRIAPVLGHQGVSVDQSVPVESEQKSEAAGDVKQEQKSEVKPKQKLETPDAVKPKQKLEAPDFNTMNRKELTAECNRRRISAGGNTAQLRKRLKSVVA